MATYRQNITSSAEPANADITPLLNAERLRGESVVTALKGLEGLGKLGVQAYDKYTDYDINKTTDTGSGYTKELTAEQLNSEFFISNMTAEQAAENFSKEASKRSIFEEAAMQPGEAGAAAQIALKGLDEQLSRLKMASEGGMSVKEYTDRVTVLTRNAIAKYPQRADEIRKRVESATGVLGADRFASNRYVQSRLNPKESKQTTQEELALATIKRVAPMGKWGTESELWNLYNNDTQEFNSRMAQANQVATYKTNNEMIQNRISSETAIGDDGARKQIPMFRALFSESFKADGLTNIWNSNNTALNDTMKLMATGKDPDVDPAAFDTLVQIHSAQYLSMANQSKIAAINAANKYFAETNPSASKAARDEVYAAINQDHDMFVAAYKPDSAIGLVAMARVRKTYAKENFETQMKLQQLQVQQLAATSNSALAKQYWNGGADRARLEQTHPEFYKYFDEQAQKVIKGYSTTQQMGEDAVSLANVQNLVAGASNTAGEMVKPPNVTTREFKNAVSSVVANASVALDKAVSTGVFTANDRTLVQSAMSTQVGLGADANILAQQYPKIYEKVSKLSNDDQAAIKASTSKASSTAVTSITGTKQALEAKYNTQLKFGVNDAGQIVILDLPVQQDANIALAYANAREEFTKKTLPLLRNLVHGRAAVTGEQLNQVAAEYAYHIGFDEPYKGFFSLEGTPVEARTTTPATALATPEEDDGSVTMADIANFAQQNNMSVEDARQAFRDDGIVVKD
jgi:hypothetical protein